MQKKSKHSIITIKTKEGTFIVFPPNNGKLTIKAERTAKGQMTSVGYYDIEEKSFSAITGMKIPFGVKCVIEENYASA